VEGRDDAAEVYGLLGVLAVELLQLLRAQLQELVVVLQRGECGDRGYNIHTIYGGTVL